MSFSRTSIGKLDLNLLSVLIVLVEERSTVSAARRLHLAQSTVAGMLRKLREIFVDELLVKNGRALEPTAQALELARLLKPYIEGLTAAVGSVIDFDPMQDYREFHLGCTDAVAFSVLPHLTKMLSERAPHCDLVVRIGDYRTLPQMLATGEITVALGYLRDDLSNTFKTRAILSSNWVILRNTAQPAIVDIASYCACSHVIVTPDGNLEGVVDEQLKLIDQSRRVAIGLSSFALLLATLSRRDLIATVPDFVAESLVKFGDFAIDPCPVVIPAVVNRQVWRPDADSDPAQKWFRRMLLANFEQRS